MPEFPARLAIGATQQDCDTVATKLTKTLKREVDIDGVPYVVTLDAAGLKLTEKGRRKGITLQWKAIADGSEALAVALNASLRSPEA